MRIAFDGRLLHRRVTGLERYTWNLLGQLAEKDKKNQYDVYLSESLPVEKNFPENFRPVIVAGSGDFAQRALFGKKDTPPDIYHLTWTGGSAADILLMKLIPSVLTVHDLIAYENPEHFPDDFTFQRNRKIIEIGISLARRIITDSEYTRTAVCNAFPVDPEKVRTILLGCDEKFHEITDADRIRTTREKYGIKGKFIFNLSTDYFHKNARNLIFAFDRLLAPGDIKATMIIAGHRYCVKGSEEIEKALTQSPQSRHIKWLEHIPEQDLCLMYNAADVFAFPSLHEGFGFPVLEAMACGTPVVAANRTSIPEVAGDAAVLVDGEDVDEIAEALREALVNESLRRSLIEKGLQQVRKFSWEKTAAETMRVYEALYEDPGAEDSLDAMEPGWQQWLRLQLMDTEHLERQVQDLNNALRLRGEHLEALLGSRTVDILRKIRSVVLSMRN